MTAHHPWLKISPQKVRGQLDAVSWDAAGLWHAVELYMADTGTDGTLPKSKLPAAVSRRLSAARIASAAAELFHADCDLWEDLGDRIKSRHWEQPPVEIWTDDVQRERWKRRQALKRNGELCRQIKERDRHLCRYCGERVNWADKRSARKGSYDHVDPDGDNTLSNVVVACKRCNGIKRDRTPDQAGMPLYRPGTTAASIAAGTARTVAASVDQGASPEHLAGRADSDPNQIRSESGPNVPCAPAREVTEPDRTKSDLDRSTTRPGTAPAGPTRKGDQ